MRRKLIADLLIIDEKTVPVFDTIHRQQNKFITNRPDTPDNATSQLIGNELPLTGQSVHFTSRYIFSEQLHLEFGYPFSFSGGFGCESIMSCGVLCTIH